MLEQTIGKRERVATADDTTIVVDSSNKLEVSPSTYQQIVALPPSPRETAVCWEVTPPDPSCPALPTTTRLTTNWLPPVTTSPLHLMPSLDIPTSPTTTAATSGTVTAINPYPLPPWYQAMEYSTFIPSPATSAATSGTITAIDPYPLSTWYQAMGYSTVIPHCYFQCYKY